MVVQPFNTEVGAGTAQPGHRRCGCSARSRGGSATSSPASARTTAATARTPTGSRPTPSSRSSSSPTPATRRSSTWSACAALGIDLDAHDIRFVEDNWASPALGAWGLGWEVWLDGMEITQFTYFQQAGGLVLDPVSVEITYGMERILMALQGVQPLQGHRLATPPGHHLRRGVRPGRVRDEPLLPRRRRRRDQPRRCSRLRRRGPADGRGRAAGAGLQLRAQVPATPSTCWTPAARSAPPSGPPRSRPCGT